MQEETEDNQAKSLHEPMVDMVHGLPGARKSKVIEWLRELFEWQLKWTHGVQFVCLAFQNAMAANIHGHTIHHWTGIPARQAEGTAGPADNTKFSTKCQCLRDSTTTGRVFLL